MHPPLEPFASGMLSRPGGAELYWETSGNAEGRPALYLHGGPGGDLGKGGYRRRFDPAEYLIVGMDQRGTGRSRPWAIDDLENLDMNTTQALIDDIEALREHLNIEAWLLHGVSWGSTLALAYALEHPQHVSAMVLTAVTTGSRAEIDWITESVGAIFPEAWAALSLEVPHGRRIVAHYAELMRDTDPEVRAAAADRWDAWESAHVSLDPAWQPGPLHEDARTRQNFALLVTHYWAHDCFLPDKDAVLARADELSPIPGALIHGRYDVSGPAITPWRLHEAWSGSQLEIVETEGHGGPQEMELTTQAIDAFAARRDGDLPFTHSDR